jgi:hypothetical protein
MNEHVGRTGEPQPWRKLYEAALLETDVDVVAQSVLVAHQAVAARAVALLRDCSGDRQEIDALAKAMVVLEDLKRMYHLQDHSESHPAATDTKLHPAPTKGI